MTCKLYESIFSNHFKKLTAKSLFPTKGTSFSAVILILVSFDVNDNIVVDIGLGLGADDIMETNF